MMSKYLKNLGHKVKIFSASTIHNRDLNLISDKSKLFIERSYDELNFVHIRTCNYSGNGLRRVVNMLQFPFRFYRVAKRINEKPDVIICDLGAMLAPLPFLISKRYKAKFILEVRDLWPESIIEYKGMSRKNPIVWLMYQIEKWIYKRSDKLVFTMEGGKDYIFDKGWEEDIDLDKVSHINNGVDLESFIFNKENYKIIDFDLEDINTFKVVYAGSIRLVNNVKTIVDAAQVIKEKGYHNIKFLIYGDGTDRKYLEEYCVENKIDNVAFKGFVNKKNIPFILDKCNLNIMHFEQNGLKKYGASLNKLFEYFASGRPIVSDCEFGYDLIKKYKCGIVRDNANSEQMAEAIAKFYEMPEDEYNSYCQNSTYVANKYDYKILTSKFEEILKR
ncbi:glycosyltransferase family 4 protein [Ruminiclostridium cellobioparum]|uniref:glycosyltransferase family 4 protein n=1 Tax=Ruminiclostridium cellobioparum TaxID=29355 RepID=UPI000A48CFC1|nr:glycosyltransferase family 4 protein [Ruminiclostridium cellobioparum]